MLLERLFQGLFQVDITSFFCIQQFMSFYETRDVQIATYMLILVNIQVIIRVVEVAIK